jgi:ABC-2 type transport system ATP-binding protein
MSDVMIEAKGLGKKYGDFVALRDASFQLHRGEILGLLGPNGAGKSTTMRILTSFIAPTTGTATVNGCDIWKDPLGVRRSMGYLPESTPLYNEMLVMEYLEWVAAMRGLRGETAQRRILAVIDEVGLGDVIAKSIRELSKGYRQRVGLAQALIHEPPILILDEPMTGLDPNQAAEIRELIRSIGKERTIILSTHNLAEVQVTCQRVLIIDQGRIVADDTPEALSRGGEGLRYQVTVLSGRKLEGSTLRDAASGTSPRDAFAKIRGVESVRELGRGEGEIRLEVVSTGSADLRAEIFRAAVEGGLVLVGLSAKAQNLEQVFQNLTTGARAGGVAEDDDEDEDDDAPSRAPAAASDEDESGDGDDDAGDGDDAGDEDSDDDAAPAKKDA